MRSRKRRRGLVVSLLDYEFGEEEREAPPGPLKYGQRGSPKGRVSKLHSRISKRTVIVEPRKVFPSIARSRKTALKKAGVGEICGLTGIELSWKLRFESDFGSVLSNKGWIGFSKSPHSDAVFSGEINLDGNACRVDPIGFGVQGHNCGYRHRTYWRWAHAFFPNAGGRATTLEALVYDLPFGMTFRKVVLWHDGHAIILRKINEAKHSE